MAPTGELRGGGVPVTMNSDHKMYTISSAVWAMAIAVVLCSFTNCYRANCKADVERALAEQDAKLRAEATKQQQLLDSGHVQVLVPGATLPVWIKPGVPTGPVAPPVE